MYKLIASDLLLLYFSQYNRKIKLVMHTSYRAQAGPGLNFGGLKAARPNKFRQPTYRPGWARSGIKINGPSQAGLGQAKIIGPAVYRPPVLHPPATLFLVFSVIECQVPCPS